MKRILLVVVILIVIIGGLIIVKVRFLTSQGCAPGTIMSSSGGGCIALDTLTPTVALPTISENIIVDLIPKNDNKVVALRIKGLTSDIESIEYELTYLTGAGLPRGVLGKISLKGEKEILRDDITLGTCSSGKCAYDTGVTSVDLSLKFNYTSGGSSVFQKTYPF